VLLRLLILIACVVPSFAAAEVVRTERVTARLVSEVARAAPGETVWVGLHLDLADGWHTYWRNPGDSGQPTSLQWRLPDGVEAGEIVWPHPQALPFGPLVNYGYEEAALHLVPLTLPADWPAGEPMRLEADAYWLVCADICVPEEGTVALDLATGGATRPDPVTGPLFERFRAQLPKPAAFDVAARGGEALRLEVGRPLAPGAEARFFPYEPGVVEPAAAQPVRRDEGGFALTLTPNDGATPAHLGGVLVVTERLGEQRFSEAFAIETPVAATPPNAAGASPSVAVALVLALAGGLLLNLMPCVLPVLSMKALALVNSGGAGSRARVEGVAYTAGVLVTFLAVGGALVVARAAGAQVGWGFQLQSPLVVAGLAYLLFAVGLNLSGLFELRGPALGGGLAPSGAASAFFTGALAVVVATPCTAPFMAAALGFALVQPAGVTLAVFAALGLGLALPFLLISFVPAVARRLPRPGPWMVRLKQGLAFPMYASAAWLVWVLARQSGPDAVFAVLAGATLLAFALWLAAPAERSPPRAARAVGTVAGVVALALLAVPAVMRDGANAGETPALGEAYSATRLDAARAAGEPVLVNMTAAWCLTCKVNERFALSGDRFRDLLAATGTTYFVGDWTNRDAAISAYLERFAHPGVPLYVVYPAAGGAPEVLAQVLTPRQVERALTRAAEGASPALAERG